jgi:hypothetical protein
VALPAAARTSTIVGMVIVLGGMIYIRQWIFTTYWFTVFGQDSLLAARQVILISPLIVCIVALLFLIAPVSAPHAGGSAQLAPRTIFSFTSRGWLVTIAVITVVIALISILAGLASRPDEHGRHVIYSLVHSGNYSASATIYGWWFSVPCLVLIAVIIAIAALDLTVISRPPLGVDSDGDIQRRRARARNVLAVTAGALILNLGAIFQSLFGISSLSLGVSLENAGQVVIGTPIAALSPAFVAGSYIADIIGFAIWWGVLLAAAFARAQRPVMSAPR